MGRVKYKLFILIIVLAISMVFGLVKEMKAGEADNVSGWAWSENIGWISFNCYNEYDGVLESHCTDAGYDSDYGVNIEPSTGNFSGYAWSENIGWISFEPADVSSCPIAGTCETKLDFETKKVSGWAKVLSDNSWIKLRGQTTETPPKEYGVYWDPADNQELKGWAWSDMVVGWISFNCKDGGETQNNICTKSDYQVIAKVDITPPPVPTMDSEPEYTKGTSHTVSCSEVTDIGVGGVEYQFCKNTSDPTSGCTLSDWSSSTSATFSGLTSGQIYYYFVRVRDSLENTSSWSSSVYSTQDADPPTPPGTPSTTSPTNDTTPSWSWTASTDSGIGLADTPYTVQWSTDNTFQAGVNSDTANTISFTHPTALSEGTWYFRVRAKDKFDYTSDWSEVGSVLIDTTLPTVTIKAVSPVKDWYNNDFTIYYDIFDSEGGSSIESCKLYVNGVERAGSDQIRNCIQFGCPSGYICDTLNPNQCYRWVTDCRDCGCNYFWCSCQGDGTCKGLWCSAKTCKKYIANSLLCQSGQNVNILVGEGKWCSSEGPEACKVEIKATDKAGNENEVIKDKTWKNFNIDWAPPEIEITE